MSNYFNDEGQSVPVTQLKWGKASIIWSLIVALGVIAAGVSQLRFNSKSMEAFVELANRNAALERRIEAVERGHIGLWRLAGSDSLGRGIWIETRLLMQAEDEPDSLRAEWGGELE